MSIVLAIALLLYGFISGIYAGILVTNNDWQIWTAIIWAFLTWPIALAVKIGLVVFDYLLARLT